MTISELIKDGLKDFNLNEVEDYIKYLLTLKDAKNYKNELVNKWFTLKSHQFFIDCFKQAKKIGFEIDGKHITININGLSLDYIVYKNKMLKVYPETQISFSEVFDGDEFSFEQENGKVNYKHKFTNPFEREEKNIIGFYCVIKNSRGEFLTVLSKKEIEKHKQCAKTSNIWDKWFIEMSYKTIIKKATRVHFNDIYEDINIIDNDSVDLTKLNTNDVNIFIKNLESFKDLESLEKEVMKKETLAEYNKFGKEDKEIINKFLAEKKENLKVVL